MKKELKIGFWLLIIILLLINNWAFPLWDQDESAYAGFGKTMLKTGDWLIPDYMYSDVHRKPPFHFWSIAISYSIFGINEFAVRFPAVISILITLLIVYNQVKKFRSETMALSSVWVLATSFLVMSLSKVSVTDATVLLSMTICGFALINIIKGAGWKWVIYFWLGITIGSLTKGPPILLFSGAFGLLLLIFHKDRWRLLKLHPWFFLPLALLPLYIWGYAAYQRDGGHFINWMIDWYIFKRVDGQVFGQTGPPGMHLALLLLFFVFYLAYFIHGWIVAFKKALAKDEWNIIIVCWLIAGWFFFEFTPSKLPAYAIGAHIPIAIIIAQEMLSGKTPKWLVHFQFLLLSLLGIGLITISLFFRELLPIYHSNIFLLGIIWSAIIILSWYYYNLKNNIERDSVLSVRQYYLNTVLLLGVWMLALPIANQVNASKHIGQKLKIIGYQKGSNDVYILHNPGDQPSLPFYIEQSGGKPINFVHKSAEEADSVMLNNPQSIFLMSNKQWLDVQDKTQYFYEKINTKIIDRVGANEYFILWKKK